MSEYTIADRLEWIIAHKMYCANQTQIQIPDVEPDITECVEAPDTMWWDWRRIPPECPEPGGKPCDG